LTVKAAALIIGDCFPEAEATLRQALRHPTAQITAHYLFTATLAHQGKEAEARQALAATFRLKPDASASHAAQIFPFENPEHLNVILKGLYKAGLPRPE
jgi:hypothetical protein